MRAAWSGGTVKPPAALNAWTDAISSAADDERPAPIGTVPWTSMSAPRSGYPASRSPAATPRT